MMYYSDIDQYMRILTNPSLVNPKVKMPLELFKEDAMLEPAFPMIVGFNIEMVGYVYWNKSNTMLVGQIKYATV